MAKARNITMKDIYEAMEFMKRHGAKVHSPLRCDMCARNGLCALQDMWRRVIGEDQPGTCTLGWRKEADDQP